MRIITGSARGRKLKSVPGDNTRPTSDRVKEAIFNIVQFDIEGRHVLDLFAGSGQMGIEALSRGAASAVFVDSDRDAMRIVRENLAVVQMEELAEVRTGEALAFLRTARGRQFGLIFIDPPYEGKLLGRSLALIEEIDLLCGNGIIVCESPIGRTVYEPAEPYFKLREYSYGKTVITTFSRRAEGELPGVGQP